MTAIAPLPAAGRVAERAGASALPPALRDENPLGIWRRVDGAPTREPIARG